MLTVLAFGLLWYASHSAEKAHKIDQYFNQLYDRKETKALLHIRQDIRLLNHQLWGILLMLGIIGDILLAKLG